MKLKKLSACIELAEGIVPGFALMQQNLKSAWSKFPGICEAILQAGFLMTESFCSTFGQLLETTFNSICSCISQ